MRIEDYALIGDTQTAALVGRDGSVDWLCLPRFDSGACFAALLGGPEHGRWSLAPTGRVTSVERRYRSGTLVLETEMSTDDGTVRIVDCMPIRGDEPNLLRRVEGVSGRVRMRSELVVRFDYGHITPWLRCDGPRVQAFAGPDTLTLDTDAGLRPSSEGQADPVAEFDVQAGEAVDFRLAWTGPHEAPPGPMDVAATIERTCSAWDEWSRRCRYDGPYQEEVCRSLVVLKALTYRPTGGMVAAPTTSLPEQLGGVRNWDYRYCWIRDATFTLLALLDGGYTSEAESWREWLLHAVAGRPEQMQIMYGVLGERRLTELELDWLPGYEGSRPVRAGNAASGQFQLDVYGELMDALHQARSHGVPPDDHAWEVQLALLDWLEHAWHEPDYSIWEIRGKARHFTYSKVMAWAAFDRGVKAVEHFGLSGPADRWRRIRQQIFDEVCERGYDPDRNTFTQYYGSDSLDAALLLISQVGFLPADDPRIVGTVEAVEKELCHGGFVARYSMSSQSSQSSQPSQSSQSSDSSQSSQSSGSQDSHELDGLPPGEGAFLACTFWLADSYLAQGRVEEGRALFERLAALANDVGLLSEEYDTDHDRLVGNFPQALSHIALVNTALNIGSGDGPVRARRHTGEEGRTT